MTYEIIKPSGVAWIGSIPSTWDCKKIGSLFIQRSVKVSDKDYPALSVSKAGVTPQLETAVKTDNGDNRKLVKSGDFVINSRSDRKGSCGVSSLDGSVSLINIVLTPRENWNARYVHYLMRSQPFSEEYYHYGRGIIADLWTTRYSEMKNICIPVPPREEQDQIVRYLDWQVSRINQLIAAKKKEISVIKEQKEAVINDAVTHGIKKDRPLKDSQMNWLPQIPVEWDTIPAKALFEHVSELRHEDDEMLAATQKYGIIAQKKYMEIEGRRIVLATDNLDKWLHVEPDEFIISLRSFQGGLEFCDISGCVTWHYVVLRPRREIYEPYYKWFFKCASYVGALQRTSDFIRDGQDLRYSNFSKVRLMVVPMEEQKAIAEHLNIIVPKFDSAIESIEKEIKILQEYSDRIISDVVTGQIDVRGVEIPEYEYTEEMIDDVTDEGDVSPEVDEND